MLRNGMSFPFLKKICSILGYFIFYLFIFILLKIMEKEKGGYFLLK